MTTDNLHWRTVRVATHCSNSIIMFTLSLTQQGQSVTDVYVKCVIVFSTVNADS
jgi:hypothetical protein